MNQTSLIVLAALAVAVGLLINRRTRTFGLVLLSLFVCGVFFVRMNTRSGVVITPSGINTYPPAGDFQYLGSDSPAAQILQNQRMTARLDDAMVQTAPDGTFLETYPDGMQIRQLADGTRQVVGQAHQSPAAILRNQRMAARADDAVTHSSPDGRTLETYPDGMQVEQLSDGGRRIVRESDSDGAPSYSGASVSHYQSESVIAKTGFIIVPVAALLLVIVFLVWRRRHGSGTNWGAVALGVVMLALLGYAALGFPSARVAVTAPAPGPYQDFRSPVFQDHVAHVASDVVQENNLFDALVTSNRQIQSAIEQPSLEDIWAKMTQPLIPLSQPGPRLASTKANQELAEAAKLVLSASVPGADPFTQGWLADAAKAIVATTAQHAERSSKEKVLTASVETPLASAGTNEPKPEWLVNPPRITGDVRRIVVSTGPYVTLKECHDALAQEMRDAVEARLEAKVNEATGSDISHNYSDNLQLLGLSADDIAREFCTDDYSETVDSSVGQMQKVHALLEFGPAQDEMLLERWKNYARQARIGYTLGGAGLAVGCLALVFGLLKVDTWTRGYYSKRLFLGVPAAIIAVGGIALFWAMQ